MFSHERTTGFEVTPDLGNRYARVSLPDGESHELFAWYTYLNEDVGVRGDNPYPIQVALKLPDSSSRYTYFERNNPMGASHADHVELLGNQRDSGADQFLLVQLRWLEMDSNGVVSK